MHLWFVFKLTRGREKKMPALINHSKRVVRRNMVTTCLSDETIDRLETRCAQLNVPRSIVVKDFVEFCLNIIDGGDVVDEIKAAMKGK
jgi:hypothetical protein